MSQPQPKRPTELAIDIEQWKRDIQTFVETTSQALNAIAAELSRDCSSGYAASFGSERTTDNNHSRKTESTDAHDSVRLAQLKSQLSQRISKTD